jgi:hypothetical protein
MDWQPKPSTILPPSCLPPSCRSKILAPPPQKVAGTGERRGADCRRSVGLSAMPGPCDRRNIPSVHGGHGDTRLPDSEKAFRPFRPVARRALRLPQRCSGARRRRGPTSVAVQFELLEHEWRVFPPDHRQHDDKSIDVNEPHLHAARLFDHGTDRDDCYLRSNTASVRSWLPTLDATRSRAVAEWAIGVRGGPRDRSGTVTQ